MLTNKELTYYNDNNISAMKSISLKIFFAGFLLLVMTAIAPSPACSQTQSLSLENKIILAYNNSLYEDVLLLCAQYIAQNPKEPFGHNIKANALKKLLRFEDAIVSYTKALELANKDKNIYLGNIASAYLALDYYNDAIDYYTKAIDDNSSMYAQYMLDIANVYILQGNLHKAQISYDSAVPTLDIAEEAQRIINNSNKGRVYCTAALVAYDIGYNADTLKYGELCSKTKSNDWAGLTYAIALALQGQIDKAKEEFAKISSYNCDPLDVATYYLVIGDKTSAMDYFNKSYANSSSPTQLNNWRKTLRRTRNKDVWKDVRNEKWFKEKVY